MKFEKDKQKINNNEIVEVETKFANPLFKHSKYRVPNRKSN
jgi:hypothetical protein